MRNISSGVLALAIGLAISGPLNAAESAKGFYLLGSRSQFAAVLPGPGGFFQNDVYLYSGDAGTSVQLPLGGLLAADARASVILELPTASYLVPALGGLAGVALTAPMGWQKVEASATRVSPLGVPTSINVSQDDFQIGDPVLQAFIGWNEGNWHWNIATALNIPVGQWEQGSLVNLGFNRWAVDVTGSATYLDQVRGHELSGALGFTFNGDNLDLDYQTGTEMHIEWSASQLTPSGFSFGVAGYHYQQISGDSGTDARLGAFKGRVTAIGPQIGLMVPMADRVLTAKFRGYYEFNVKNRLEGASAIGTLAVPLQPAAR